MTPRDRRAAIVGGAVVLLAVLLLRVVPWGRRSYAKRQGMLAEQSAQLVRAREVVRAAGHFGDSMEVLRAQLLALAPRILAGTSEAEATADLTSRFTLLAETRRAKLDRADPQPDSAHAGELRRVTVRATFTGDSRGITGIVRDLDRQTTVTPIVDVRIEAPAPQSPEGVPEVIVATLTVQGWYLARERR